MLAALIAVLGLGGLVWGTAHFVRSRLSEPLRPRRERHRRLALAAAGVGGTALLVPDLLAGLVVTAGEGGTLTAFGWFLYRFLAFGAIGIAALVMWLSSDRVTSRIRRGVDTVVAVAPLGPGRQTRRMRRRLGAFPQQWNELLEHDRELTRQLLSYQRDAETAAARPTMADLEHPLTKAAAEAMFRCDEVRTMAPPAHMHDVLATEYGQAVATFHRALDAAERYADAHVAGTVTSAEQRAVADATRTLTFLQTNATTPDERASAYQSISERLAQAGETAGTATSEPTQGARAWLPLEDRAKASD